MRETFDDAFFFLCDARDACLEFLLLLCKCMIWLTIPFWLLPYVIIVAKEEEKEKSGGINNGL